MVCSVVVGGFFGAVGLGKIVSYLSLADSPRVVARGGIGPTEKHSVTYREKTHEVRMIPCGFINADAQLMIGPGVLVDSQILLDEVQTMGIEDRTFVDRQCGVVEPRHAEQGESDTALSKALGRDGVGCGVAVMERAALNIKLAKDVEQLQRFVADVPALINETIEAGHSVLLEGAHGSQLSLYHGFYPYVTCKDVTASAICSDLGVGPTKVDEVVVVFKPYVVKTGEGPLPGEITRIEAEALGLLEYSKDTGEPKRIAPFDLDLARREAHLNGATQIAITELDALFPAAQSKKAYRELPPKAASFVERIEESLRIPVTLVGTGRDVYEIVDLREEKGSVI